MSLRVEKVFDQGTYRHVTYLSRQATASLGARRPHMGSAFAYAACLEPISASTSGELTPRPFRHRTCRKAEIGGLSQMLVDLL